MIVSDNGSSDETAEIAVSFASRMTIRVVDAGGAPGSNYARNCGVRAARHQRILLCDGDDRVDADWLTAMSRGFDEGHQLMAGPIDYVALNPAQVRAWRGADRASTGTILNFLGSGHGANLGFTKSLWNELNGFDESFEFGGPDIEFCWRAQLRGTPLHTVPDAIVHYRLRPSLRKLYKQSRAYGAAEAHLYQKFAQFGLDRRPASAPIVDLWWILTRLPFAVAQGRRGAWLRRLGQQIGRFEGSARYRVLWW
ncbi:hypothetical protein N801_07540 [Knoellia aerolata DSM 18566]|uniref:Glycosyltransferase 2-like domain-containing protein n=1 Tax=Knoellia aerolata DSM 18566 TaxID=1385519 RepID=A0A0A0JXF7_9MICO|nr:hypothetical protein N801_07540 [Knoellia aerolata DSM 18566]